MALLIQKDEALRLLRQQPKHYLWKKNMSRWSEEDIYNLRSGINPEGENAIRDKVKNQGQPVIARNEKGEPQSFKSVVLASKITGVSKSAIYTAVNGRPANCGNYEFVKI